MFLALGTELIIAYITVAAIGSMFLALGTELVIAYITVAAVLAQCSWRWVQSWLLPTLQWLLYWLNVLDAGYRAGYCLHYSGCCIGSMFLALGTEPVSYTHLTLPTRRTV